MVELSCELFSKWKNEHPVKYIRCDNAGENKTLQKRANGVDWKLNIEFEFTPRDTPQHNHLAELRFASIANKGRALLSAANVPMKVRLKVWVKAFEHATNLDSLIVMPINAKTATRIEHWCGNLPKWVSHLHTWRESGTVKTKIKTTPKLAGRGIQCMFVGHSKDHDGDCFDMYYPKTNSVDTTRDVIWLNRMYYTKPIEDGVQTPMYLDADSAMANASDQLPSNQAGDDKSDSTHDSSDESSDVDPEMEFGADETKSIDHLHSPIVCIQIHWCLNSFFNRLGVIHAIQPDNVSGRVNRICFRIIHVEAVSIMVF
jgi:hypothetical protein